MCGEKMEALGHLIRNVRSDCYGEWFRDGFPQNVLVMEVIILASQIIYIFSNHDSSY